jgi:hypothetical protein
VTIAWVPRFSWSLGEQELWRRSSDEQLGGRGSFGRRAGAPRGVAKEARTRGIAAPAFAGCAFCRGIVVNELWAGTQPVKHQQRRLENGSVKMAPGGQYDGAVSWDHASGELELPSWFL